MVVFLLWHYRFFASLPCHWLSISKNLVWCCVALGAMSILVPFYCCTGYHFNLGLLVLTSGIHQLSLLFPCLFQLQLSMCVKTCSSLEWSSCEYMCCLAYKRILLQSFRGRKNPVLIVDKRKFMIIKVHLTVCKASSYRCNS